MSNSQVVRISPADFQKRLEGGESIAVLDVREDRERAYCAISLPESIPNLHIPIGQVPSRFDELDEEGQRAMLVVYCHHGVRSMAVAEWLVRNGLTSIANLEGGIDAWSQLVDPSVPRY
ncbi:rhodanese-like domain-containing protein [Singulisphaera rosea]